MPEKKCPSGVQKMLLYILVGFSRSEWLCRFPVHLGDVPNVDRKSRRKRVSTTLNLRKTTGIMQPH